MEFGISGGDDLFFGMDTNFTSRFLIFHFQE